MATTEVLATPLRINNLEIKNRIILGPMAVLRPTEDGRPSAQTIAFLARRARGAVGLIIVGGAVASERAWCESLFSPKSMGENVTSTSGNMLTHGEPQAFRRALGSDVRLFLS